MDTAAAFGTVLVAGPAGSGKSTLVGQWADQREQPAAWLTLDRTMVEQRSVWRAVQLAITRASTLHLVGTDTDNSHLDVVALLNAIDDMRRPITLVLDDTHHVVGSELGAELDFFIRSLPDNVTLVLCSRIELPIDLVGLRADRRLGRVNVRDLAFTAAEAHALFTGFDIDLEVNDLSWIMEATDGWPTGLCLTALTMHDLGSDPSVLARCGDHFIHIRDYVRARVEPEFDTELAQFVVEARMFDRIDAALCRAALTTVEPQRMIDELRRRHLVHPDPQLPGWFQLHPMLRAGARRPSDRELAESSTIRFAAAQHLEQRGMLDAAIQLVVDVAEMDDLARLIAEALPTAFAAGRFDRADSWLRILPTATLRSNRALCRQGLLFHLFVGELGELRRWSNAWLEAHAGTSSEDVLALLVESAGTAEFGDLQAAINIACRAARLSAATGSVADEAAFTQLLLARYSLLAMRYQDAIDQANQAMRLAQRVGHRPLEAAALGVVALIEACSGSRGQALLHVADARTVMLDFDPIIAPRACREIDVADGLCINTDDHGESSRQAFADALRHAPGIDHDHLFVALTCLFAAMREPRRGRTSVIAEALVERADRALLNTVDVGPLILDLRLKLGSRGGAQRPQTAKLQDLSQRELLILQLLRSNLTLPEIANELYLSVNTVKTHCRNIYRKTGARNRSGAVQLAFGPFN
jgi:LuxR family transcriptional regulator, maltose regulon positive regulatory protein